MISNPDFIYYACIAKGTTVLAQYDSKEPKIEDLAAECLAKAPIHHSMFSHTVKKRNYTFFIGDPFVYFAIFDEQLVKSEGLWFLNHIKCSFDEVMESRSIKGSDDLTPLCFQSQFDSIFHEAMALNLGLDLVDPLLGENKDSRNRGVDSVKGKKSVTVPLLAMPVKGLKKKKRVGMEANEADVKNAAMEDKVDICDCVDGFTKDFQLSVPKGAVNDRQKPKQTWKKHVWVVLLLDLFVCAVLFVIWLWVCRGFKCMER